MRSEERRVAQKMHFLLFPGYVVSKCDSNRHYINAAQLRTCYGLDPRDCTVYSPVIHSLMSPRIQNMIWLMPRFYGDYSEHRLAVVREWMEKNLQSIAREVEHGPR